MNQQPDKLFRQKLEGFHKPVPGDAWSKVERRLKNNNKGLWLKIAASIMLLAVASFYVWTRYSIDMPQNISQNKIPVQNKTLAQKQNTVLPPEDTGVLPLNKKSYRASSKKLPIKKQPIKKTVTIEPIAAMQEVAITKTDKEIIAPTSEPVLKETEAVAHTKVPEQPADEITGITLVFTAEETEEKYLDKKSLAQATSADKKTSTLRKLLDKAYDLKNNQDPFGELRQKKNEILALNFKNEKQRSQNK